MWVSQAQRGVQVRRAGFGAALPGLRFQQGSVAGGSLVTRGSLTFSVSGISFMGNNFPMDGGCGWWQFPWHAVYHSLHSYEDLMPSSY